MIANIENRLKMLKRQQFKLRSIIILMLAVFLGELFIYTWCRVEYVNLGYEIARESEEFRKLSTMQNKLKIELERLKSPDRIAKIAQWHIGLTNPGPSQMVVIP